LADGGLDGPARARIRMDRPCGAAGSTGYGRRHGVHHLPTDGHEWSRSGSVPSSLAGTRMVAPQLHDIHTASSPYTPEVRALQRRWAR
jgi:hypothetical protein